MAAAVVSRAAAAAAAAAVATATATATAGRMMQTAERIDERLRELLADATQMVEDGEKAGRDAQELEARRSAESTPPSPSPSRGRGLPPPPLELADSGGSGGGGTPTGAGTRPSPSAFAKGGLSGSLSPNTSPSAGGTAALAAAAVAAGGVSTAPRSALNLGMSGMGMVGGLRGGLGGSSPTGGRTPSVMRRTDEQQLRDAAKDPQTWTALRARLRVLGGCAALAHELTLRGMARVQQERSQRGSGGSGGSGARTRAGVGVGAGAGMGTGAGAREGISINSAPQSHLAEVESLVLSDVALSRFKPMVAQLKQLVDGSDLPSTGVV